MENYHVMFDEYEQGVMIRCLNDERTKLMEQGKSADAVEDLLVKVGRASSKRFGRRRRRVTNEER